MSQACTMWRGDIGAYIVGAIDPGTAARVRRHLRACRPCRADYQDLVPMRDWLSRAAAADGIPDGIAIGQLPAVPPLAPIRPWHRLSRRGWLTVTGAAAAAAVAAAVVMGVATHPAAPAFRGFDRASGVHGQARLLATPAGTQIELTVTGLPAREHCTLVAVSAAGTDVAGSWNATYSGAARVEGTTAIPVSRLTALRIESPTRRLLLRIAV